MLIKESCIIMSLRDLCQSPLAAASSSWHSSLNSLPTLVFGALALLSWPHPDTEISPRFWIWKGDLHSADMEVTKPQPLEAVSCALSGVIGVSGIPSSDKHMKWKSIFSKLLTWRGTGNASSSYDTALALENNFTVADQCWKWSAVGGRLSYEITMT